MELVAKLTENISRQEIKSCLGEYVLDTQMGSSLVSLGKGFITSDHSPLGELCLLLLKLLKSWESWKNPYLISAMLSRYLVLSGIQLSQTSILVEIQKLAFFLLENVSESTTNISGLRIPKIIHTVKAL